MARTPRRPLNATAASLLGFLHQAPMTGWDLVATAQQAIGAFWTLTQSQVYRELAAMADAGLVRARKRGPRDRQPYAITAAGRAAFKRWINQEPGLETVRFPLLVTLMFGQYLSPEQLATFVHRHRAVHAERLADYEAKWADARAGKGVKADPSAMATLVFGLKYERAVLEWFDELPVSIRGSDPWAPVGEGLASTPTSERPRQKK